MSRMILTYFLCDHLNIVNLDCPLTFDSVGLKGEPGQTVAEKGQAGVPGQNGEPGQPGAPGKITRVSADPSNVLNCLKEFPL